MIIFFENSIKNVINIMFECFENEWKKYNESIYWMKGNGLTVITWQKIFCPHSSPKLPKIMRTSLSYRRETTRNKAELDLHLNKVNLKFVQVHLWFEFISEALRGNDIDTGSVQIWQQFAVRLKTEIKCFVLKRVK